MRAKITAISSYLPEKVLTNFDLEKIMDTSDEWIRTRTGISERHIAAENEATSDMVAKAIQNLCEKHNISPDEFDMMIVATDTPDTIYPSTACWVQKHLKMSKKVPAFDMEAGCTGWLYGLEISAGLIESGRAKKILLAGAETMSKAVNWDDRATAVLFGDGAGAVLIEPSEDETGILSTYIGAEGALAHLLYQPAGGSRIPASKKTIEEGLHGVHMAGNEVFRYAVRYMQMSAEIALKKAGLTGEDISIFIPHQANLRIIDATCKRVGVPLSKTYITIDKIANISAGTIPISLDMAVKEGKIKKDDIILLDAFGGGFTWGAAVIRW